MIINLSESEYYSKFSLDPHPFLSKNFLNLNKSKVDQVLWLAEDNSNPYIGLVVGLKDGILLSPFSAPFGGVHFRHELMYVSVINEFLENLKIFIQKHGYKGILITLPPNIYNQTINSKLINCLFYCGFKVKIIDITSWVDLKLFDYRYKEKTSKEHLKQAINNDLIFSSITEYAEKSQAYQLIMANRAKKNRPIYLSFNDLNELRKIFDIDYFVVRNNNDEILASAICYRTHLSVIYLVFWGDNDNGRAKRAMDFCIFNLLNHYKKAGFNYLDIGISTENGIPNEGLLRFKESHEATSSLRYTFNWTNETIIEDQIKNYKIEPINRYGITLRLVVEQDAEFIFGLRHNSELNKFISPTSPYLTDQVKWIHDYKIREDAGREYYFIALDEVGNKYGTIRLYDLDEKSFELGSWLFLANSPIGMAVKAHFIGFETGFEVLGAEYCKFEIRKKNTGVLRYMKDFKTTLVREDDLNFYYTLTKESFYKRRSQLSIFNSSIDKKIIQKEKVVLLGSAGVGAAFASAKTLRKHFKVKIIACDTNPSQLVTTNLFADFYEQIPPVADMNFNVKLIEIIKKYNIDTYVPFIDQEVVLASKMYELGEIDNRISLQVKESFYGEICADKYSAHNWLVSNSLPSPRTFLIDNKSQFIEGWILKPRKGFGSVIHRITKNSEININNLQDYIMQEKCENPEITVDVHYSQNYNFFEYLCRERIETKSGVCTKARLFKDSYLGEIALNLAKKLNLSSFCFQVMCINNEFVITDINPRLGAGSAMSVAVGMDFFAAMFANLWNQNPKEYFINFDKEKYVTRQYCEFVM